MTPELLAAAIACAMFLGLLVSFTCGFLMQVNA